MRIKRRITVSELAADVLSQIEGEPDIAEWEIQEYADACLAYIGVTYLPEPWILELVAEIQRLRIDAMRVETVDLGSHTLTVFSPETIGEVKDVL